MCADDVQLHTCATQNVLQQSISNINHDLNRNNNGLCLNTAKTQLILIYKRKILNLENVSVRIGDTEIYGVKNVRNLGLTFNSTLNWTCHITCAVGKVHGMLRNLRAARFSTPLTHKTASS